MGYPHLDEISEERLTAELTRRKRLRWQGLCDYCERHSDTPSCKFPDRHQGAKPTPNPKEQT